MSQLYIGLMSGTSLDGADAVLMDFSASRAQVVASANEAFPNDFQQELLALNTPGHNELHRAAVAANRLAQIYSKAVKSVAHGAGLTAQDIQAVGAHGQTVRHRPDLGYTTQLNNPALLAELTGIDVVADFRSRDVAAQGQGAPLVPAFHQSVFSRPGATALVLNIGGISNLSVLPAKGDILGFDCGPGNALMDAWCFQHTGQRYDENGKWAASGRLIPELLSRLLTDPYFAAAPPKSTGRDLFSTSWLHDMVMPFAGERPEDVQNTLTELTASVCSACVNSYLSHSAELIVCGGGALNSYLLQRLQVGMPSLKVSTSDVHGLPPLQVEAAAFAWLARQTMQRKPGNLPSVTGAAGLRVLGAIYPA